MEDRLLIFKLKCGSRDALLRIYEKYGNDMFITARNLLGDRHSAEDVLHDVFVILAQSDRDLKIHSNLRGFLMTCVANQARDMIRSQKVRSKVDVIEQQAPASPADKAIESEEAQILYEAMAQIPYQQREVILMHLRGKMNFRQIGQSLLVSTATAQSRYRYGLEKLRSLLKEKTL